MKPPLTSPITYSQKPGNRNPSPTWRPGHPRSDIQKAEIAPPAATQSIHRKIFAKKQRISQLNFRSPSFRTLADATPKETKRLWSRSRENHEMNLPISQCKIHTMCSFYTQYCQEINISFPKASIPHLKMFQGQLVLRQIQVLNHWHGLFCPAYVWLTIVTPLLWRPIKMPTWIHKMFTNSSSRVGELLKIQMKRPWQQGFLWIFPPNHWVATNKHLRQVTDSAVPSTVLGGLLKCPGNHVFEAEMVPEPMESTASENTTS